MTISTSRVAQRTPAICCQRGGANRGGGGGGGRCGERCRGGAGAGAGAWTCATGGAPPLQSVSHTS
jgi:hypothetical protein